MATIEKAEIRFVELMAKLFQLDEAGRPDFGCYRVIRHHNQEVVRHFCSSMMHRCHRFANHRLSCDTNRRQICPRRLSSHNDVGNDAMRNGDQAAKHLILLAEDDEVNQEIIQAFLKDAGDLELVIANDGRAALEVALTKKFALLIVDQNMPFITGDRLVRHLRSTHSINSTTPVIRFTAEADKRPLEIKTLDDVTEVTLPKPLSKDELILAIRALLA